MALIPIEVFFLALEGVLKLTNTKNLGSEGRHLHYSKYRTVFQELDRLKVRMYFRVCCSTCISHLHRSISRIPKSLDYSFLIIAKRPNLSNGIFLTVPLFPDKQH